MNTEDTRALFAEPVQPEEVLDPVAAEIIGILQKTEETLRENFELLEGQKGDYTFDYDEGPVKYLDFQRSDASVKAAERSFLALIQRIVLAIGPGPNLREPRLYFYPGTRVQIMHTQTEPKQFAVSIRAAIIGFEPWMGQ